MIPMLPFTRYYNYLWLFLTPYRMKYAISGTLCLLLAFGCSRTNQQTQTAPITSSPSLDSAYFYMTGPKEIMLYSTKFNYDDQGRYLGMDESFTDSTMDHISASPGTDTETFTYNGNDSLPDTYLMFYPRNYYPGGTPGPGMLKYDDRGRIILDSPSNTLYTVHYTYGDNYISRPDPDLVGQQDTLFTGEKNIPRFTISSGLAQLTISYSDYPNPFYLPRLAAHAGALLFPGRDIISQNLFSKKQSVGYYTSGRTYDYTWTLNADGQVASGVAVDESTGQQMEYYRFVYKK